MAHDLTRRETLKTLAVLPGALAAGVTGSLSARAATETQAPRKLRIAIIGIGGRGQLFLEASLKRDDVEVAALCDVLPDAAAQGANMVEKAGRKAPALYTQGPQDYRRLLQRDDVDAVFITTPAQLHGPMSADSLRAHKWVFSEVPACNTLPECRDLVAAAESTDAGYFFAENYCFTRENLLILNLVEKGAFGTITLAECGYIHDCRNLMFNDDGSLTWRGQENSDPNYLGNCYPTHSLGPVSLWLGITRGDRFARCLSMTTKAAARRDYALSRFGKTSAQAKIDAWLPDSVTSLIQTDSGAMVTVRFDSASPRPHHMDMYTLQGTKASYDDCQGLSLAGKAWQPLASLYDQHDHPMWRRHAQEIGTAGHGGGDFFTLHHFYECVRSKQRPGIDVYDAVTWSALIELSRRSILDGNKPEEYPDFTNGKWRERKRYDWSATT